MIIYEFSASGLKTYELVLFNNILKVVWLFLFGFSKEKNICYLQYSN